jgi:tRNA G18 (ribose-2'-O)-methylase SpoU
MTNTNETIFIYGKNAVLGALEKRPDTVERVFLEKGKIWDKTEEKKIYDLLNKQKISKEIFIHQDLARELQTVNHQGILAKVHVNELTVNFEYFLENLEIDQNTCLVHPR